MCAPTRPSWCASWATGCWRRSNGAAALRAAGAAPDIRLLFTDVGLPGGMNGRQLADAAARLRPGLPVLFTTGYARNAIVHGGRLDPGLHLITKPFTRQALAAKLREVLDGARGRLVHARLLVVEDEVLVRMVAVDVLREAGYEVEEAGQRRRGAGAHGHERRSVSRRPSWISACPTVAPTSWRVELRALRADLPLVIASGYDEADMRQRFADARCRSPSWPSPTSEALAARWQSRRRVARAA